MEKGLTSGIVVSRHDSTRLPGKALLEIGDKPLLERVVRAMKRVRFLDHVVLATTRSASDDQLEILANNLGIDCHRGSATDVLERVVESIADVSSETIVVAYGDNPLLDPALVETLVAFREREDLDYAFMPGLPLGCDVSVFSRRALEKSHQEARKLSEREHLNAYITAHPELFRFGRLAPPATLARMDLRLTVDTDQDLQLMRDVEAELSLRNAPFELGEVLALAQERPEIFLVNADIDQKYATSAWERLRRGNVI